MIFIRKGGVTILDKTLKFHVAIMSYEGDKVTILLESQTHRCSF